MYCDQCEQTPASGCTRLGVCGKDEDLASLQDTLLMGLKGLSAYATHARSFGRIDPAVDGVVHAALYSTLTNVNFDVRAALGPWRWARRPRLVNAGSGGAGSPFFIRTSPNARRFPRLRPGSPGAGRGGSLPAAG